ncbi:potassium transport protein [Clostridium tetani 12124569]|nr:potassium transport protein [Clostridium tetani 12124569]
MNLQKFKMRRATPFRILALGFAIVILTGTILLNLSIATNSGEKTPLIDCFFISTSATCVTGLVTVDTGTHWNYFGKTVIMLLIEIGGLGFMSFGTLVALILGKKITLKERLVMQEAYNFFSTQGVVKMVKYILIFTFSVQLGGALILSTQFIPELGMGKGIYYSIFHSVSAFCNAGFDLIGNYSSITGYYNNSVIIVTISLLIIIGGLGFYVWQEIYNFRGFKKLSLHSKICLSTTSILIVVGAILMFLFEFNNPGTMKNMGFKGKMLSSFFASVSPRTAGFNSISTSDMTTAGKFLTIIFMFIGGSPGSTAGGIKTTTAGLMFMTILCVIKGREDTEIFQRRVPKDNIYKALAIVVIGFLMVTIVTMLLSITDSAHSFENLLYEATSAFGTVGLTLGITTKLSFVGKIIIALTMYAGRVGPLTLALALSNKKASRNIKYPEGKVLVG